MEFLLNLISADLKLETDPPVTSFRMLLSHLRVLASMCLWLFFFPSLDGDLERLLEGDLDLDRLAEGDLDLDRLAEGDLDLDRLESP